MKLKTFAVGCALALAIFLFAQRRTAVAEHQPFTKVVDLTHTIGENAPNWEGTAKSPYSARTVATYEKDGYFARDVSLPEHFATHVDAPAHFAKGQWTVDQIPPERFVRPLVVLDVAAKARTNPDYLISVEDIATWEQTNGHMPPGAVVVARTGWGDRWASATQYRNADAKGAMHFPAYSLEAAQFLVEGRGAIALGIDTLSIDPGPSTDYPVHHYSAGHDVYHIENLANLADAPAAGALVIVAPAKLEGGSGAPVRVMALVP